jgi:hypothetical protein
MTRGEAMLAMEGGARVRQVWTNDTLVRDEFWIQDKQLRFSGKNDEDIYDEFFDCWDFELVPEPDTAEKFVRDMAELLKRDPKEKSLFWLCEKATPDTHDYTWRQRFDALLAQMDGEK